MPSLHAMILFIFIIHLTVFSKHRVRSTSSLIYNNIQLFHNVSKTLVNFKYQKTALKNLFLSILLFSAMTGAAQSVYYKGEVIYVNNKPFAILKQTHVIPLTYAIESFGKDELIRIYPGKILVKGRQYYIVTFMNDGRQAIVPEVKDIIKKLVMELAKNDIIKEGMIHVKAEGLFIKKHPVPVGYEDVENTRDFGSIKDIREE